MTISLQPLLVAVASDSVRWSSVSHIESTIEAHLLRRLFRKTLARYSLDQ